MYCKLGEVYGEFGEKAVCFNKLKEMEILFPDGFAISWDEVKEIMKGNISLLQNLVEKLDSNKKYVVRSAALEEDGKSQSFAGVFESVLNVSSNIEEILEAVDTIVASAENAKTLLYTGDDTIKMGVIIQEMIVPIYAGVAFTQAYTEEGQEISYIEFVKGLSDKLVSGKVHGNCISIPREKDSLDGNNLTYTGTTLDLSKFSGFANLLEKFIGTYDSECDIEWCIDESGNIQVVQCRPITAEVHCKKSSGIRSGIVIVEGVVGGEIQYFDDELEDVDLQRMIEQFPQGAIFISDYLDTKYYQALEKAAAIISGEGSVLCHAAIIAREKNIPCILGVQDIHKLFSKGKRIFVDTFQKKMVIDGKDVTIGKGNYIDWSILYDFSNLIEMNIFGEKVLYEVTPDGISLYFHPYDSTHSENMIIRRMRTLFGTTIRVVHHEKYLWYFEFKRFRNMKVFKRILRELEVTIATNKIELLLKKLWKITLEVVKQRNKRKEEVVKFYYDELLLSVFFLSDMYVPLGLGEKKFLLSSVSGLLECDGSFEDLFSKNELFNNEMLQECRKYLEILSYYRDSVTEKFIQIGAYNYDYFNDREERAEKVCKEWGVDKKENKEFIDLFYDNIHVCENLTTNLNDKIIEILDADKIYD